MPTFGQKNVNSVKNTHYGPKKSVGCHFFHFFTKKLLPNAHISSKKRQFCQKYTLWTKKVNRMSFFSIFSRKITDLRTIRIAKTHNGS